MKQSFATTLRVLAIDPSYKGFGFAVLEESMQLIDFGLKRIRNTKYIDKVESIIDQYLPDVIVIEDSQARECRRRLRARKLLHDIELMASARQVEYVKLSRLAVGEGITEQMNPTKYKTAVEITKRFPELESYLPYLRKSWT